MTHSDHPRQLHALSFDLEDWFHMMDVPGLGDPADWPYRPTLVEGITGIILDLLDHHKTKATFFVLGWIAEHHPTLVSRIALAGHEIACHAYWHRRLDHMTPDSLSEEIALAIKAIFKASGQRPYGFRAPSFSITPGSEWIFDVLLDHGFNYDASLFPAHRDNGGYLCPRGPHMVTAPSGRPLPELPMSIMDLGPWPTGFSGGGYLRILPMPLIHRGFSQCRQEGRPAVVYLHPRDFAVDGPDVPMPRIKRFKSRVGLASTLPKLDILLTEYRFAPCEVVLEEAGLLRRP